MIKFKDFEDVDISEINNYVMEMYDFVPMETEHDYFAIIKCIRKILEIVEKGKEDEIKKNTN